MIFYITIDERIFNHLTIANLFLRKLKKKKLEREDMNKNMLKKITIHSFITCQRPLGDPINHI